MVEAVQQNSEDEAPFQLRGGSFTSMVLRVIDPGHDAFFTLLAGKLRQAPGFFRNAPVVLDLDDVVNSGAPLDFRDFMRRLREQALMPVGVVGGSRHLQEMALTAGLAVLPPARSVRPMNEPEPSARAVAAPVSQAPEPQRTTVLIDEPVRSGQQIYAAKGDLVITAPVGAGAELLADGHIHIYGALRGRALAGVSGDITARIFVHSLEAELVSIAGLYRVSEDIDREFWKKPVQIFLDQGYLRMQPLG